MYSCVVLKKCVSHVLSEIIKQIDFNYGNNSCYKLTYF